MAHGPEKRRSSGLLASRDYVAAAALNSSSLLFACSSNAVAALSCSCLVPIMKPSRLKKLLLLF